MAKELYDKEINYLTDWGGDESTGGLPVNGRRILEFIKNKKIGYIRTKENIIQYFKDETLAELYDKASETDKPKYIMGKATVFIDRAAYNVQLVNNLEKTEFFASLGKECFIDFSFISQKDPNGHLPPIYTDTNERGTVTIYKRLGEEGELQEIIKPFKINSGKKNNCKINISEYLVTGENLIQIVVEGEDTKQKAILRYQITLTTLNLNADKFNYNIPWLLGTLYIIDNLKIEGKVDKLIHIRFDDFEEDLISEKFSASTLYDSYNIYIPSDVYPVISSGEHSLTMWLSSLDNSISTKPLTYKIICVNTEDKVDGVYISLNNIPQKIENNTTAKLFNYVIYADSTKKNIRFLIELVTTSSKPILIKDLVLNVNTQSINLYELPLVIESDLSEFNLKFTIFDADDLQLLIQGEILVDNTSGFGATSGYTFYMNPKNRNNFEGVRDCIINEVNKSIVPSKFSNFNWNTDGWIRDDYTTSLKLYSGSKVHIDYNPFKNYSKLKGLTLEISFKTSYVSNYEDPFLTISLNFRDTFQGIKLTPSHIIIHSNDLILRDRDLSCFYKDDTKVHLTITINSKVHRYDNFYVVRVYLNGHLNREFTFDGLNDDWIFNSSKINIGNDTCDLNIYGLRFYEKSLTLLEVFKNYLNWVDNELIQKSENDKNNLWDISGTEVDYKLTKKLYNVFTVLMYDNADLPSIIHPDTSVTTSNLEVFYKDHPEWNFKIINTPIEGLGTTAMTYYRWNLRWKTSDASTWYYADGHSEINKYGTIDNHTHRECKKITAKKNYASSMQSHKMGSVNGYTDLLREYLTTGEGPDKIYHNINELDKIEGLKTINELDAARVTIYQYPFVGFQKILKEGVSLDNTNEDDYNYKYIGLYTLGPDKSDDRTFGFNEEVKPDFLAIEGADNTPWLTMFLIPWKLDGRIKMIADINKQCLCRIIKGTEEQSWHYSSGGSTYQQGETLEELAYSVGIGLEKYWRPAYNFVFECNANIKPFNGSLEDLNALVDTSYEYKNSPINYWCNDNCLYYYEVNTNKYENACGDDKPGFEKKMNLKEQSNDYIVEVLTEDVNKDILSESDKIHFSSSEEAWAYFDSNYKELSKKNEIYRKCRIARFKKHFGDYFDLKDTIFYRNYIEFNAASDNKAKNTYPYNFCDKDVYGNLTTKWRWRADDLDTIFDVNNQGLSTKEYYVEFNDFYEDGSKVWAGSDSVLWNMLDLAFPEMIQSEMEKFIASIISLGGGSQVDLSGITSFYDKYYFDETSNYFAQNLYNKDAEWSYEEAWIERDKGHYSTSDTNPISLSLGNHYLPELRWITNRALYMMSKYKLGFFKDGYSNTINYRAYKGSEGNTVTYQLTPALLMYPRMKIGNSILDGKRTKAGEICTFIGEAGDGQHIIMGSNYLSDIGTFYDKPIGETLTCNAYRLQKFLLGNSDPLLIKSLVKEVKLECPSLKLLDLLNLKTLGGSINLNSCIHLLEILALGSSITSFILPKGIPLKILKLPNTINALILKNIITLEEKNLIWRLALDNIKRLFIDSCPLLNTLEMTLEMYLSPKSTLEGIRLTGLNEKYMDSLKSRGICGMLYNFGKNSEVTKHPEGGEQTTFTYKGLFEDGTINPDSKPIIEGDIYLESVYNIYKEQLPSILDGCVLYPKGTEKPKGYKLYIEYGSVVDIETGAFELIIVPENPKNTFSENNIEGDIKYHTLAKDLITGAYDEALNGCNWDIQSHTLYDGVQLVENLQTTGLYFDTGILNPTSKTIIEIKAQYSGDNKQYIFGTSDILDSLGIIAKLFGLHLYFNKPIFHSHYENISNSDIVLTPNKPYIVKCSINLCIILEIESQQSYTLKSSIAKIPNNNLNIFIGANNYGGEVTDVAAQTLYYCKIYEGDQLIKDFIPTKDYDNKPCLFDKVSKTFIYPIKNTESYSCIAGEVLPGNIEISDKLPATISQEGLVTIKNPYIDINANTKTKFIVTAHSVWNSNYDTEIFNIEGYALKNINLTADKLFVFNKDTFVCTPVYVPSNTTKQKYITFESSHPDIVKVDASTGLSQVISDLLGLVSITAINTLEPTIKASCDMYVNDVIIIDANNNLNEELLATNIYEAGKSLNLTHYSNKIYSLEAIKFKTLPNSITPNTITTFEQFKYFKGITNSDYIFKNSADLQTITLPNTLNTIGVEMFANCPKLNNLLYEDLNCILKINNLAFYKCSSLPSNFELGLGLKVITNDAFKESSVKILNLNLSDIIENINLAQSDIELIILPNTYKNLLYLEYSPKNKEINIHDANTALLLKYQTSPDAYSHISKVILNNNKTLLNYKLLIDLIVNKAPLTEINIILAPNENEKLSTVSAYVLKNLIDKDNVNLLGIISTNKMYKTVYDKLKEQYPKLDIRMLDSDPWYLSFEDPEIAKICYTTWGDGVGVTKLVLTQVSDIYLIFTDNTKIKYFDEFEYFKNIKLYNTGKWFANCTSLERIKIPLNLTTIEPSAFFKCTDLSKINLSHCTVIGDRSFEFCSNLKIDLNLPHLQKIEGWYSFLGSGITSIANLGNLTRIGDQCFDDCANLESVILPESIEFLGRWAFAGCSSLKLIIIPDSYYTQTDLHSTFLQCTSLEEVTIPKLINRLYMTFDRCSSLKTIHNIENVTSISDPFGYCSKLETFPDFSKVTNFEISLGLRNCYSMPTEDLNLKSAQNTTIGVYLLDTPIRRVINLGKVINFGGLIGGMCEYIKFPSTIETFKQRAFGGKQLRTVVCEAVVPPIFTERMDTVGRNTKFYVPDQSVEQYKTAETWSKWADRIFPISALDTSFHIEDLKYNSGPSIKFRININFIDTAEQGYNWEILKGQEYISIDDTGLGIISSSANNSEIAVKCSLKSDPSISTTKNFTINYYPYRIYYNKLLNFDEMVDALDMCVIVIPVLNALQLNIKTPGVSKSSYIWEYYGREYYGREVLGYHNWGSRPRILNLEGDFNTTSIAITWDIKNLDSSSVYDETNLKYLYKGKSIL